MGPHTCNKGTLNQTILKGVVTSLAFLHDEFDENDRDEETWCVCRSRMILLASANFCSKRSFV